MKSILGLGKLVLAPAVLAVAALACNTASASTVNVPFSFAAAGHVWPAGAYDIQKDFTGSIVTVKSMSTGLSFSSLLGPGEPALTDTKLALKFDTIGNTHALRTIQYGGLITSQLDKKLERSERLMASGR
jgi:tryptophan synthase beta subunit